jgi:hypothetical protein
VRGGGHRWGSWKRGGRGKRSLFFLSKVQL